MNMPKEIQQYFRTGRRRLKNIVPNAGYSLTLEFDNGDVRIYELENKLTGVLFVLKDVCKFNEVFIDEQGNIAWDIDKGVDSSVVYSNRIDLCADSGYIYGRIPV